MKNIIIAAFALVTMAFTNQAQAQKYLMVGGAEMYPTKDIVDNANRPYRYEAVFYTTNFQFLLHSILWL